MKKFILFLLLPLKLWAQPYTGVWSGWIEAGGTDVTYQLVIFEGESGPEGYAMTTMIIDGVKNVGIKSVRFKLKKNSLLLEDDELVFSNFSKPSRRVIMSAELKYEESGTASQMSGAFRTRSLDMRDRSSFSGKVYLKKEKGNATNELTAKLNDLKLYPLRERSVISAAVKEKNLKEGLAKNDAPPGKSKEKTSETKKPMPDQESLTKKSIVSSKPEKPKKEKGNVQETNINNQGIGDEAGLVSDKRNQNTAEKLQTNGTEIKETLTASNEPANKPPMEKKETATPLEMTNKNTGDGKKVQVNKVPEQPAAAFISTRKIELIHDFLFSSDTVDIVFYDNGIVDGDTISVMLNDQLLIAKEQLSTEPLTRKIAVNNYPDSINLIMYAENLGLYPPNSGVLIIKDGKSRVDVRFSGDLNRSAAVRLIRKK